MGPANLVGFILFAFLFMASFLLGGSKATYFNLQALLIVLGGTLGTTFLSYPAAQIYAAFRVVYKAYLKRLPNEDEIVSAILDFALKSKYEGILSLENETGRSSTRFLKDGLDMLVDGYNSNEMKSLLGAEIHFFKQRREKSERIFRSMAKVAPPFGLIGSVIGLMEMLTGIGDAGIVVKTIPVALISTLYGIIFTNFLFTPIAESIYVRTQAEIFIKQLILNGLLAIHNAQDMSKLEKQLFSFLAPAVRPAHEKTFNELRRQYLALKRTKNQKGDVPSIERRGVERRKG